MTQPELPEDPGAEQDVAEKNYSQPSVVCYTKHGISARVAVVTLLVKKIPAEMQRLIDLDTFPHNNLIIFDDLNVA
jgi:hypothetical protein